VLTRRSGSPLHFAKTHSDEAHTKIYSMGKRPFPVMRWTSPIDTGYFWISQGGRTAACRPAGKDGEGWTTGRDRPQLRRLPGRASAWHTSRQHFVC